MRRGAGAGRGKGRPSISTEATPAGRARTQTPGNSALGWARTAMDCNRPSTTGLGQPPGPAAARTSAPCPVSSVQAAARD